MAKYLFSRKPANDNALTDLGVVLLYATFAAAWVIFSDRAVEALISTPEGISLASTLKGWLFVAVTSLLLYALLHRRARSKAVVPFPAGLVDWPRWALYVFAGAVSVAMLLVRMQISVAFDNRPLLIILMFPVILSAILGGIGPGLLSTLIVSAGFALLAILPAHTFDQVARHDFIQWGFLIVNGALVSFLAELMRRSWGQANAALTERLHALGLLETLSDSSDDAIFAKDLEGRYLLFNRAASQFVGKSPADVLGRDDRAIFPPEQAEMLMETERRVVSENRIETNEEVLDTPQGTRVFLATKGPLRNGDGKVIGTFGISRDITERKQAETARRESEARYLALFDNAVVAIMIHDRDNGAVLDANRRAIESYGLATLEELQRMNIWMEPPYSYEDAMALIRKAANEGPQCFEWKNRDRYGRIYWEDVLLNRITLGGIERVLSITTDITSRKAAEEALSRQTGELRSRNEELERFNRAMVGRELEMVELKRQINALSGELGRQPPFRLDFLDDPAIGDTAS